MSVYKKLDPINDIVVTEVEVSNGMFNMSQSISTTSWVTASSDTSTYYHKLIVTSSENSNDSYDICTVAYGFSGSAADGGIGVQNTTESVTIYKQFTHYLVGASGTGSAHFQFNPIENASTSQAAGFLAISFARERYRDRLQPGYWELCLTSSDGLITNSQFVDGAATSSNPTVRYNQNGRWDYVYSGSRRTSTLGLIEGEQIYGIVYHDLGIIILDCSQSLLQYTGSPSDGALQGHRSASLAPNVSGFLPRLNYISGKYTENLKSTKVFCRVWNKEFNYSQNPTFRYDSNGEIVISDFKQSPKTYITGIGIYNLRKELIAIAKVETPLENSFLNEHNLAIRLDF